MAKFINPFTDEEHIPPRLKLVLEELQYFEDVMNVAALNADESEYYERLLDVYRQEINSISFYMRKGREEQNFVNAKSMLKHGIDIKVVHEITGISLDELRQLLSD